MAFLASFLTGCLATESSLRAHDTANAAGHLNMVKALSAKNETEVKEAKSFALQALDRAQKLETEAAARDVSLGGALADVAKLFVNTASGGSVMALVDGAISENRTEDLDAANKAYAALRESIVESSVKSAENTEGVRKEAKADLAAYSSNVEDRWNKLDTSLQVKFAAAATHETIEALQKAADKSEQDFRNEFNSRLGLTEEEAKQAGEFSMEELLGMLAALLTTGGASTFAARRFSNSGAMIRTTDQKLEDLKTELAKSGALDVKVDATVKVQSEAKSNGPTPSPN